MVEGPTTTVLEREEAATRKFQLEYETPREKKKHFQAKRKRERALTKDQQRTDRINASRLQPATEEETWFRHTNWKAKRQLVRATLIATGTTRSALERFDECGGDCMVQWSDDLERYRVQANYCKCRHCEPCQRAKANKISNNLREKLEENKSKDFKFITLTLKHRPDPLHDQITAIYAYFKILRRYKFWKDAQRGGCTMLEVKYNKLDFHNNVTATPWHVHLHIISEGTWMDQRDLASAWKEVTGDSFKVDIREVKTCKDAAFYVSKYVTKGTNDSVWLAPDAAQEWVTATKGVRTAGTFGSWRGFRLLENPKELQDWRNIGKLSDVVIAAKQGKPWAVSILRNLTDNIQYDPHKKRNQKKLE